MPPRSSQLALAQVRYEIAADIDPLFPNVHFNLALVLSINKQFAAAITALAHYRQIASPAGGRKADDLLSNLKKLLAAAKSS